MQVGVLSEKKNTRKLDGPWDDHDIHGGSTYLFGSCVYMVNDFWKLHGFLMETIENQAYLGLHQNLQDGLVENSANFLFLVGLR
jgi:hypothetical protein